MLERADGRRNQGTILAGDEVRIRVPGTPYLLADDPTQVAVSPVTGEVIANPIFKPFTTVASGVTAFTILHNGDHPEQPSRLGEYFLETDAIQLSPSATGRTGWRVGYDGRQRELMVVKLTPMWEKATALVLRREGAEAAPEPE